MTSHGVLGNPAGEAHPPKPGPAGKRWKAVLSAIILAGSAFMLFYNLGAYALWDDEALQTMTAEQVWRTGDTSVMVGRNIIAYYQGAELDGLHDRANSPLPAYFLAPFVGSGTTGKLRPRLPFAACGLAFVALFLLWLWKSELDRATWLLFGLAILGNVSMFLYFRQVRYYGIALLCSLAIAYLYLRWNGSRRALLGMSLVMFCLLASHIITYAAVCAVLVVDYLLWRRTERPLALGDWAALILPQAILGAAVLSLWNPFRTPIGGSLFVNSLAERAEILWWNLRDFNASEVGPSLVLLIAPVLFLAGQRRSYLWRGPLAIVVYCAAIAAISPKIVRLTWAFADVRYLTPLIPLGIATSALTLRILAGRCRWLVLPLGLFAFGTNLFNFGPLLDSTMHEGLHASPVLYWRELTHLTAGPGPYTSTAQWMKAHMQPGASVYVQPGWDNYPLMYQAPEFAYAWQLANPPGPKYDSLDPINFAGLLPPDYMIAFGPFIGDIRRAIEREHSLGIDYEQVATLNRYWQDVHRPGLLQHAFEPITRFRTKDEAIYVFRRRKSR